MDKITRHRENSCVACGCYFCLEKNAGIAQKNALNDPETQALLKKGEDMFLRIARWLIVIILFLIPVLIIPQASSEETAEDKACSSKLFGTVSAKTCEEVCPKASAKCFKTHEYPSETGGEKLECYTCARDQQCSEIGAIDWWGCFACDANPATECIKAGFTPPFGGGPFGGKTWSGVQCYKCVPRPDR